MLLHFFKKIAAVDWLLLIPAVLITITGLVTMYSYGDEAIYFQRQLLWLMVSVVVFFIFSAIDFRFLRRTEVVVSVFLIMCALLAALFLFGTMVKGAQSWFSFGLFSFQPSDPAKIAVVIILAKYFTKRHREIAHLRHIIISGFYTFIVFILVFLQPDFGSAIIIFLLWIGMVAVSGISKKHLLAVFFMGIVAFGGLWMFAFEDYQKDRIKTFLYPLADIQGSGYNAYQSTIAVGSGQVWGKGVGFGTQSKLQFLPEYQTDFIFAAYAEEWGFLGVIVLFCLYGLLISRLVYSAWHSASNFEALFMAGIAILITTHFTINVGMNIGLLPVTGITVPFMSYGGSHLLTEYVALAVVSAMQVYRQTVPRETAGADVLEV